MIFCHLPEGELAWPRRDFDYEGRKNELIEKLKNNCPGIDFTIFTVHNPENAKNLLEQNDEFDGILCYVIGSDSGAPPIIARSGKPALIVDDLYGAADDVLTTCPSARREGFPVFGKASSHFEDIINSVKLFKVKKRLSEAKVLVVASNGGTRRILSYSSRLKELYEPPQEDVQAQANRIKELFGTEIIGMGYEELNSYYNNVTEQKAEEMADKWINEALRVVEPTRAEIVKSAKLYFALKKAVEEKGADAVTIDCYGEFDKLPAFPCLALFQMNNEGFTAVCEADLSSTITQLLVSYLIEEITGEARPGFVNDPVFDLGVKRAIYAHCTATNRVFGPNNSKNPYALRSHGEMREGAAIQSLMPLNEKVTAVQIHFMGRPIVVIHRGKTVANEDVEKACRTKLAVETNVEKIWENWNKEGKCIVPAHWHRVVFYGDWKGQLQELATIMRMNVFEEDKA